jgi:hypothetical protein
MDIGFLKKYIPEFEMTSLIRTLNSEDGAAVHALLERIEKKIREVPELGSCEKLGMQARARLHYFHKGTDIFISELDRETGEAFGFVCLNCDYDNAELGYISIPEIVSVAVVNLDLYFDDSRTLQQVVDEFKQKRLRQ